MNHGQEVLLSENQGSRQNATSKKTCLTNTVGSSSMGVIVVFWSENHLCPWLYLAGCWVSATGPHHKAAPGLTNPNALAGQRSWEVQSMDELPTKLLAYSATTQQPQVLQKPLQNRHR